MSEEPERQEDLPEFDYVAPLKDDEDKEGPGIDPIVTVPPED